MWTVTQSIMKAIFILCLAFAVSTGHSVFADALSPTQLKTEQDKLCELLAKASPSRNQTNRAGPEGSPKDFSPYLTTSENAELVELLSNREVSAVVTREQALAAIQQREIDHSLPGFQYNCLMSLIDERWPRDPTVIAFYREALATRGDVAIDELFSPLPGVWDDSLVEPVVNVVERLAPNSALRYSELTAKTVPWISVDNALSVLERHHAVWATDATIPPRLSKAVLVMFPSLTNLSSSGPKPGDQMWCNAVRMLSETYDLTMINVLRPFLEIKSLAGDGSYWLDKDRTPGRVCDKAAIAIKQLLGERDFNDEPNAMPGVIFKNLATSYSKWDEWDKKIAELQKRLDAAPSK